MANLEITVEMAEFTREMYNELKESGYINDESVIIQMSHEIGKELSDILSQKTEIIELNNSTQKKIILGEIDNGKRKIKHSRNPTSGL